MYAGALLFACLAAYAYKSGGTAGLPRLYLCCYPRVVTLLHQHDAVPVFLCSLKELLFDQEANDKHNFVRHFGMLFLFGGSMVATTVICNLLTGGNNSGTRAGLPKRWGCHGYLDNIISSVKQVFTFFLPGTSNHLFPR